MKDFPKRLDSKTSCLRIAVPENLDLALEGLIRKVLREQPKVDDIHAFAAEYFETLLRIRDKAGPRYTPAQLCPFHNDEDAHEMVKLAGSFKKPEEKEGKAKGKAVERGKRTETRHRTGESGERLKAKEKKKAEKSSEPSKQSTPDLLRRLPRADGGKMEEKKGRGEGGGEGVEGEEEEELVGSDPIKELVEKELMMQASSGDQRGEEKGKEEKTKSKEKNVVTETKEVDQTENVEELENVEKKEGEASAVDTKEIDDTADVKKLNQTENAKGADSTEDDTAEIKADDTTDKKEGHPEHTNEGEKLAEDVKDDAVDKREESHSGDTTVLKESGPAADVKEDLKTTAKESDFTGGKKPNHAGDLPEADPTADTKELDHSEDTKEEDRTEDVKTNHVEDLKEENRTADTKAEDQTESTKEPNPAADSSTKDSTEDAKEPSDAANITGGVDSTVTKESDFTEIKESAHAENVRDVNPAGNSKEEVRAADAIQPSDAIDTREPDSVGNNETIHAAEGKEEDKEVDKEGDDVADKKEKESSVNAEEGGRTTEVLTADKEENQIAEDQPLPQKNQEKPAAKEEKPKTEESVPLESSPETLPEEQTSSKDENNSRRQVYSDEIEKDKNVEDISQPDTPKPETDNQRHPEEKERQNETEGEVTEERKETVVAAEMQKTTSVSEKADECKRLDGSDDSKKESKSLTETAEYPGRAEKTENLSALEKIPEVKDEIEPEESEKAKPEEAVAPVETDVATGEEATTAGEEKRTTESENPPEDNAGERPLETIEEKPEVGEPEGEELCTVVDIQNIPTADKEKASEEPHPTEVPTESEELCVVVDSEHIIRVEAPETGNENPEPSEEVQIKTIQTHYYDTLQVPETVTKELRVHSMSDAVVPPPPEVASAVKGTSLLDPGEADSPAETTEPETPEPKLIPLSATELNLGSDSHRSESDDLLDLSTPTSGYSLNLSDLSWQTISGMFLESERQHSSLGREELRFSTPKTSNEDGREAAEGRTEVDEVFHKTEIPGGVRAVPVPPRDLEEVTEERGDEVLEKGKEEKKEKEEDENEGKKGKEEENEGKRKEAEEEEKEKQKTGSEGASAESADSSGNGKSIDSDVPLVAVEVKTVIETQFLDEEEEEGRIQEVEVKVKVEVGDGEEKEEKKEEIVSSVEGKEMPKEEGSGEGERRPSGSSGSGEGAPGAEGSSGESESTVSSTATEIKRSDFARRRLDTGKSLLTSQSLDKYTSGGGGRNPLLRTRSLSTFRHGVTDFEVWNAIEKELEEAATKIQSRFRRYKTRKKLQRENAVQITTEESSPATATPAEPEESLQSTGEFHDSIVLSEHPR